jgi:DNA-binding MarR family transcriptional regulator
MTDDLDSPDLAVLLAAANRGAAERVTATVRAAGHDAVQPSWAPAMRALAARQMTLTGLAEELGLAKQTLSRTVDEMERAGYLRRRPGGRDRRIKLLALTAHGRGAAEAASRASREIEEDMRAATGAVSVRGLRNALGAFLDEDAAVR